MTTKTATEKTPATKRKTTRKPAAKKAPAAKPKEQTITIDGKDYELSKLSDQARTQITNVQAVDQEIARLQQQLAIYQTARTAYARALREELPKAEH